MRNRFAMAASILALVVAAGGCASGASSSSGGAASVSAGPTFPVTIVIDNNLPSIQGVSAYLVVGTGGKIPLGPVDSNKRRTFTREGVAGNYHLTARARARDPEIVSDEIQVTGPTTLTWHLASNTIVAGQ